MADGVGNIPQKKQPRMLEIPSHLREIGIVAARTLQAIESCVLQHCLLRPTQEEIFQEVRVMFAKQYAELQQEAALFQLLSHEHILEVGKARYAITPYGQFSLVVLKRLPEFSQCTRKSLSPNA